MAKIYLTRRQYDLLLTYCQNWVDLQWREYKRQWGTNGVQVWGSDSQIENLRCQIAYCADMSKAPNGWEKIEGD